MMNTCKKRRVAWNTRRIVRSPFRRLSAAKAAERSFWSGRSIGFTARASLKSMGRIPRSDGCYTLGSKYR